MTIIASLHDFPLGHITKKLIGFLYKCLQWFVGNKLGDQLADHCLLFRDMLVILRVNVEENQRSPQLADATYAHILVFESGHEYKVDGPYGSNFPLNSGFLWHYL